MKEKWMGEKEHIIILACAECVGGYACAYVCMRVCMGGYACKCAFASYVRTYVSVGVCECSGEHEQVGVYYKLKECPHSLTY